MGEVDNSRRYLEKLHRYDLACLLTKAHLDIREIQGAWREVEIVFVLTAPRPFSDALRNLPNHDEKRVVEAILANEGGRLIEVGSLEPDSYTVVDAEGAWLEGVAAILPNLLLTQAVMIDVATGGARIQEVEDHYRARHFDLKRAVPELGLEYPVPFDSLWDWFNYWRENLPTWADRRQYIRTLFAPLIEAVSRRSQTPVNERELTGWERVDRGISKAQQQLSTAAHQEDFQAVGLLCREVLISLAQEVFDPVQHASLDGVTPSSTDAKRMLEAFLHSVYPGNSFKEVRAHARASVDLSLNLQHRRTATRQLAALCLEATASTVAVVKILSSDESPMG